MEPLILPGNYIYRVDLNYWSFHLGLPLSNTPKVRFTSAKCRDIFFWVRCWRELFKCLFRFVPVLSEPSHVFRSLIQLPN
jgi:hypothetical protein